MATLNVRKLDDNIYEQLRIRAVTHGISMEEEARQIISQAVTAPARVSDIFRKYFGKQGVDIDKHIHRKPHKPMSFSE